MRCALHDGDPQEKLLQRGANRLAKQPYGSAEASVIRNYLDVCLEVPWGKRTQVTAQTSRRRASILDRDHFGLQEVKERILEIHRCAQDLAPGLKGQILCLVGPPGVGKTSIAHLHRRGHGPQVSTASRLGGVRDEADIRGHRKTYIGAMPGRIIDGHGPGQRLHEPADRCSTRSTSSAATMRGDPSSALLEVLDTEQNDRLPRPLHRGARSTFASVLFITTANDHRHHPRAAARPHGGHRAAQLHRRGKAARSPSSHLLPKQLKEHGLATAQLHISRRGARMPLSTATPVSPACASSSGRSPRSAARAAKAWSQTERKSL